MYGKIPANAMTINVYSLDNVLVRSFSSQVAAANWVNIPLLLGRAAGELRFNGVGSNL